jgi:hypothetical protein
MQIFKIRINNVGYDVTKIELLEKIANLKKGEKLEIERVA